MTRNTAALIVAAHANRPRGTKHDENSRGGRASSHKDWPKLRRGPQSSIDSPEDKKLFVPIIQSRKIRKIARTPLTPIIKATVTGLSPASPTPAQRAVSVEGSSPEIMRTIFNDIAEGSITELASDKTGKVKARVARVEMHIVQLEALVHEFKGKVLGVVKEFEGLRDDIDHLSLEFEALEDDHVAALACVEEEKFTTQEYIGKLRNAEAELEQIYQHLPEAADICVGGLSQAQSSKAIFERYS